MACDTKTPGCPGPYELETCDSCAAKEGERCLRSPPSKKFGTQITCGGTFSTVYTCQMCKAAARNGTKKDWESLVVDRGDRRNWLKTLKPLTVQQVYDASSCVDITPAEIDHQYQEDLQSGRSYLWCPWVRIGNLYTTVTTGNDAGWRLLVQSHLQPDMRLPRDISVFTGRHGNPEGTITKDDHELFFDGVMDGSHYLQDILQKVVTEGLYSGRPERERPVIRLWDVGTTSGTTMTTTQQLALERLLLGEIVIFAWCWSLLSFYKVSKQESVAFRKWHPGQGYNKPIKDIVAEKYGWVHAPHVRSVAQLHTSGWYTSSWRSTVNTDHEHMTKSVSRLFPQGLADTTVTDQKQSLSDMLEQCLKRPVHHH